MSETVSTYSKGQRVTFEGRAGVVVETSSSKADPVYRVEFQIVTVEDYAGRHMISSRHSALAPA